MYGQVPFIELVYMWDLNTLCCLHCTYSDISVRVIGYTVKATNEMSALSENPTLKIPAYQAIFTVVYTRKNFLGKNLAKVDICSNWLSG